MGNIYLQLLVTHFWAQAIIITHEIVSYYGIPQEMFWRKHLSHISLPRDLSEILQAGNLLVYTMNRNSKIVSPYPFPFYAIAVECGQFKIYICNRFLFVSHYLYISFSCSSCLTHAGGRRKFFETPFICPNFFIQNFLLGIK